MEGQPEWYTRKVKVYEERRRGPKHTKLHRKTKKWIARRGRSPNERLHRRDGNNEYHANDIHLSRLHTIGVLIKLLEHVKIEGMKMEMGRWQNQYFK